MTETATTRRPPAPKGALPAGVTLSRYWRETPNGPLVKHDHERPVNEATDLPTGLWWMCPDDSCRTGEWVFPSPETGEPGSPKKRWCADHGSQLLPGRSEATDGNPQAAARSWLRQRLAERAAEVKQRAADAANVRIAALRAAGRTEAERIAGDLREHVPSAAVSAGALVVDYALLEIGRAHV